jgi:hypothetical protein
MNRRNMIVREQSDRFERIDQPAIVRLAGFSVADVFTLRLAGATRSPLRPVYGFTHGVFLRHTR